MPTKQKPADFSTGFSVALNTERSNGYGPERLAHAYNQAPGLAAWGFFVY